MKLREFERLLRAGVPATFTLDDDEIAKRRIGAAIIEMVKSIGTQQDAAIMAETHQPTINYLVNEHYGRFRVDFMLDILVKLGAEVQVTIKI